MSSTLSEFAVIENPAWSSISTRHRALGNVAKRAATYDPAVSVIGGISEATDDAMNDLAELVAPGTIVAIMAQDVELPLPTPWRQLTRIEIHQMVCDAPKPFNEQPFLELGVDDVDEMIALVQATEPGPFETRTIEMGTYLGVRDDTGKLVAMAGERFKPEGWTEISGVCTDPSARGSGYAASLVGELVRRIDGRGERSFLHVVKGSPAEKTALGVYERIGFRNIRGMAVAILRNDADKQ